MLPAEDGGADEADGAAAGTDGVRGAAGAVKAAVAADEATGASSVLVPLPEKPQPAVSRSSEAANSTAGLVVSITLIG